MTHILEDFHQEDSAQEDSSQGGGHQEGSTEDVVMKLNPTMEPEYQPPRNRQADGNKAKVTRFNTNSFRERGTYEIHYLDLPLYF